jgi:hypothetical protein
MERSILMRGALVLFAEAVSATLEHREFFQDAGASER